MPGKTMNLALAAVISIGVLSNPALAQCTDSDGDGFSDGEEVAENTDPNNPFSHPVMVPAIGAVGLMMLCGLLIRVGAAAIYTREEPC